MGSNNTKISRIYHGSDVLFTAIDLNMCKSNKDFGRGFYTTENYDIAKVWALRHALQHRGGHAYVYMLYVDMDDLKKRFNVHKFRDSIAWVDYIIFNRDNTNNFIKNTYRNYDVVIGKIADARTQLIIQKFCKEFMGVKPTDEEKRELVRKLTAFDLKDQICFKSNRVIEYIQSKQPNGRLSVQEVYR